MFYGQKIQTYTMLRQVEGSLYKLKYIKDESPIHEIKRISKPSRRVYVGKEDIPLVKRGFGISILSTSKGIASDAVARDEGIGGEILLQVW